MASELHRFFLKYFGKFRPKKKSSDKNLIRNTREQKNGTIIPQVSSFNFKPNFQLLFSFPNHLLNIGKVSSNFRIICFEF